MIKPIKKGTHVWLINAYSNCYGTVYEEMIVDSWGAKQAHFRHLDETMLKRREYTSYINSHALATHIFEVGTVDIEVKALEIDAAAIQQESVKTLFVNSYLY